MARFSLSHPRFLRFGSSGRIRWALVIRLLLLLLILVAVVPAVRQTVEFMSLNYLYHLGQQEQWEEAWSAARNTPPNYRDNPRYSRIMLHILLHLPRNSEALDFIRSQTDLLEGSDRHSLAFQRMAAFGLIVNDRESDALELLKRNPGQSINSHLIGFLESLSGGIAIPRSAVDEAMRAIEREIEYPAFYSAVVQFLKARSLIDTEDYPRAVAILQPLVQEHPYVYLFRRELGIAHLETERIDLAGIELRVAHVQLHDPLLFPARDADRTRFRERILSHAADRAITRTPEDFWRLMRSLEPVLAGAPIESLLPTNGKIANPVEAWEWLHMQGEYSSGAALAMESRLTTETRALLDAMQAATDAPPLESRLFPISDLPASVTLRIEPVQSSVVGLVQEGDQALFMIPPLPTDAESGFVLLKVYGSVRDGIPGGGWVDLGIDRYWLALDESSRWYAFTIPPLSSEPIAMQVGFVGDAVVGYTTLPERGDRNLYIRSIMAGYVVRSGQ